MPVRTFEVRIHTAGTVTPTDGTVDFTISDSRLVLPPEFGGQTVRPLQGKSEFLPYSITVVDDDEWLTAQLFSGGRPVLVGRLAEVRLDTDGQGFSTVDVRRVAAVRGGTGPEYEIELSEERWVGRGDMLFGQNTTLQLVPQMPTSDWFLLIGGGQTDPLATEAPGDVLAVSGSFVSIQSGGPRIEPDVRQAGLEADVIDDPAASNVNGNFRTLKFEDSTGLAHPVVSFGALDADTKEDVLALDAWKVAPEETPPIMPNFWVYWPVHGFSVGQNVGAWRLFWPDGIPTTASTPYLIGKKEDTAYPVADFLADIYNGVYGGTQLRFDPAAVAALRDIGEATGNWWVVTAPVPREDFLAELYRAHLIVPFTEPDGTIAPRQVVPASVDSSTLFVVDRTTAATDVTYENSGRELANAFRLTRLQALSVSRVFGTPLRSLDVFKAEEPIRAHSGVPDAQAVYETDREQVMTAGRVSDVLANFVDPLFDLAGDGAQVGTVRLVSQVTEVPQAGDTIIVDLDDLRSPNAGAGARSGRRACVVLERKRVWDDQGAGIAIRFWDLGPALNATVAHQDAEAHDDTHDDAAHDDVAHDDQAHGDTAHTDTHSDSAHSDSAHSDVAHVDHTDSHNDTHNDHTDGIHSDLHSDHDDAGSPTHSDGAHDDVAHGDQAHGDSHSDSAHVDSAHGDSAHSDAAHADDHGDAAHVDVPHGDLPHGDAHDDIGHGDGIHGDSAHADSPHDDQPHDDHSDGHFDSHLDHTDQLHGDEHSDHDDTPAHDDVAHTDAAHSDTSHSDQDHTDYPESDGHDDVTHKDDAHDDGHTDVPHNDLAA